MSLQNYSTTLFDPSCRFVLLRFAFNENQELDSIIIILSVTDFKLNRNEKTLSLLFLRDQTFIFLLPAQIPSHPQMKLN
jgi:hypothetical protein